MLFFKEIYDTKLDDPDFKSVFKRECHICANIVKSVSLIQAHEIPLQKILDSLHISQSDYDDLAQGENCRPKLVVKLMIHLGLNTDHLKKTCPRLDV